MSTMVHLYGIRNAPLKNINAQTVPCIVRRVRDLGCEHLRDAILSFSDEMGGAVITEAINEVPELRLYLLLDPITFLNDVALRSEQWGDLGPGWAEALSAIHADVISGHHIAWWFSIEGSENA